MKLLTTKEFSEATGIPVGTLRPWSMSGKLVPVQKGTVNGQSALYSEEQISAAMAMYRPRKKITLDDSTCNNLFSENTATEDSAINNVQSENPAGDDVIDDDGEIATSIETPAPIDDLPADESSPTNSEEIAGGVPSVANVPAIANDVKTLEEKSLQELANETRFYLKRSAQDIIEAGRRLIEAKKRLPHGEWQSWLERNIELKYRTAANIMAVAERFGSSNVKTFADLSYSACVKLLALPEGTEEEFIEGEAAAGRPVSAQSARDIERHIKEFKKGEAATNATEKTPSPARTQNNEIAGEYFDIYGRPLPSEYGETLSAAQEDSESATDNSEHSAEDSEKPLVCLFTGNNEWYTPAEYIEAAREVLGTIDLDPASCELANQTVKAGKFFSADEDGLSQNWHGNIWLNPPYASELIRKFVDKLLSSEFDSAIVLTDACTDTKWFEKLAEKSAGILFTNHRIKFLRPDGTEGSGSPTRGQAFFYFGDNTDKFFATFAKFGWCAKKISPTRQSTGRKDINDDK